VIQEIMLTDHYANTAIYKSKRGEYVGDIRVERYILTQENADCCNNSTGKRRREKAHYT